MATTLDETISIDDTQAVITAPTSWRKASNTEYRYPPERYGGENIEEFLARLAAGSDTDGWIAVTNLSNTGSKVLMHTSEFLSDSNAEYLFNNYGPGLYAAIAIEEEECACTNDENNNNYCTNNCTVIDIHDIGWVLLYHKL